MKTLCKEQQSKITPDIGIELLRKGNERFITNRKFHRDLIQQMNETSESQHPFAVIISCMDSRTSAELIFDQGIGDVFSIRVAGNVINDDIIGSTEYGCKVVGAKVVLVLGHTQCGAINGAVQNVELGHLSSVTQKIRRNLAKLNLTSHSELCTHLTRENVLQGIQDLRSRSSILSELEEQGKIHIIGGIYDLSTGKVEFYNVAQESVNPEALYV
jgi:carbonic anhydrase